jgi:uncharacterized protein
MIRLITYIIFLYIIYRLLKRLFLSVPKEYNKDSSSMISEMVQDPFCKTYIPKNEAYRTIVGGEEILFCSKECAEKYKEK